MQSIWILEVNNFLTKVLCFNMVDMGPRNSQKKYLKKIMLGLRAATTPIFRVTRNCKKIKISIFCLILTCLVSKYMFLDTRNRLEVVLERLDHRWGVLRPYLCHTCDISYVREWIFLINVNCIMIIHYYTLL